MDKLPPVLHFVAKHLFAKNHKAYRLDNPLIGFESKKAYLQMYLRIPIQVL